MARRTLLVIASILTAALGTALIWLYVQGAENRALQEASLVPALFLNRQVEAGRTVDATMVTTKQVPPDVAAGAVTDLAQVAGKTLSVTAVAQQLLLPTMFSATAQGRFPKDGAVALTVTDPHRVPADLRAGDVVDVYALKQNAAPRLVVRSLRVRSVGPAPVPPGGAAPGTAAAGTAAVPLTIVGFDANTEDAEKLYAIEGRGEQPALYVHNPTG